VPTNDQTRWPSRTRSGWVIGRVAGAPVVLAPSWLIVAAFLTWFFVPPVRSAAPDLGTVATVAAAFGFPVLLAVSVLVHEIGHGLTGRRLGAPPTEYVITLWGGHTQFDRELRSPGVSALVSIAGPITNAALAVAAWSAASSTSGVLGLLLWAAAVANGFVAGFNLLPGLPLDGGRVLEAIVWKVTGDRGRGTVVAGWGGRLLAIAVAAYVLGRPLLQGSQPTIVAALTGLLVSGFLWFGASQAIRGATAARRASAVDLLALARPAVAVPVTARLGDLDGVVAPGVAVVLVAADGRPVAVVDPVAAGSVPSDVRGATSVQAVASPIAAQCVVAERFGLPAVRAMSAAQFAGPVAVLVDPAFEPPRVVGLVQVAAVAQALGAPGRR
jgi:Zn-dependent protease